MGAQSDKNINDEGIADEDVLSVINDLSRTFTKLYEYDKDKGIDTCEHCK